MNVGEIVEQAAERAGWQNCEVVEATPSSAEVLSYGLCMALRFQLEDEGYLIAYLMDENEVEHGRVDFSNVPEAVLVVMIAAMIFVDAK